MKILLILTFLNEHYAYLNFLEYVSEPQFSQNLVAEPAEKLDPKMKMNSASS